MMAEFTREAEAKISQHLRTHPASPLCYGAIWSYDNPSIHDVDLTDLGITEDDRAPLPPQSGDMHKVIEHVHARVCDAFREWVARNPRVTSPTQLRNQFEALFYEVITPASVHADVQSLPALWQWIRDHNGDYAPASLR